MHKRSKIATPRMNKLGTIGQENKIGKKGGKVKRGQETSSGGKRKEQRNQRGCGWRDQMPGEQRDKPFGQRCKGRLMDHFMASV